MSNSNTTRRILIVEPDPSLRELLRYLLASEGHNVDEAQSRSEALEKLERTGFDVVLTGSNELEVKRDAIVPRVEARSGATPVLQMNCDPARDPAEELGRFMFNPFDLDSLRQALAVLQALVGIDPYSQALCPSAAFVTA
jgi:DNA-binding NtrC family response regulator